MKARHIAFALICVALALAAGCGRGGNRLTEIRVGYFPNLTHSQAVIGAARGTFQDSIGPDIPIKFTVFNAGPSAIEALSAGAIDITYVGPNPAINGYLRSNGKNLRVVAGACSGGAVLVVRSGAGIHKPGDLSGKRLATPQLGNTQDVALRHYLAVNGLKTVEKGGTVRLTPIANPDIYTLFKRGEIDGAWVPEPWGARLVREAGGRVFLDERTLWPGGRFSTTIVVVSEKFLREHPDLVKKWIEAHVELTLWIQANPAEAKSVVNSEIKRLTGKELPLPVMDDALARMMVTYDPLYGTLEEMARGAYDAGFLGDKKPDLRLLCDLRLLNQILRKRGLPAVR